MSLSFREQAAIAQLAAGVRNMPSIRDDAQKLADSCCKVWGHDYVEWRGENGNGRTVWIADACVRCGAKK